MQLTHALLKGVVAPLAALDGGRFDIDQPFHWISQETRDMAPRPPNFAVAAKEIRAFLANPKSDMQAQNKCTQAKIIFEGRNNANTAFIRTISMRCDDKGDIMIVVPDNKKQPIFALVYSKRQDKPDGLVLDPKRSGKWTTSFWDVNFEYPATSVVGTSVWTGRALQAGFDRSGDYWSRASVFGPLSGACCSWPSWISARIRSHSRQGPKRPDVPPDRGCDGETVSPSPQSNPQTSAGIPVLTMAIYFRCFLRQTKG